MSNTDQRTLVTFVLDRSGSMEQVKDDTIGAFNAYLSELKKDGDLIDFSLIQFDTIGVEKTALNVPVAKAPTLTTANYVPRAGTPLIDAAYKTIKAVEEIEGGRKIVICIQTDGQENSSVQHTWDQLQVLIKEKTALGWQFNFMGCGIDAYQQGALMGMSVRNTMSYGKDSVSTAAAFRATAANTMAYASGMSATMDFSDEQKVASGDVFDPAKNSVKTPPAPPVKTKAGIVDDFSLRDGS